MQTIKSSVLCGWFSSTLLWWLSSALLWWFHWSLLGSWFHWSFLWCWFGSRLFWTFCDLFGLGSLIGFRRLSSTFLDSWLDWSRDWSWSLSSNNWGNWLWRTLDWSWCFFGWLFGGRFFCCRLNYNKMSTCLAGDFEADCCFLAMIWENGNIFAKEK